MKNYFANLGYFIREVKTIFKLNLLSNALSLLSTGLIFFILAMVISGWWVSNRIIETLQGEAEVSVYYHESINESEQNQLVEEIKSIKGVQGVRRVDEIEAQNKMEEILGQEAKVLAYFDESPFSAYIEVKISLEEMDEILEKIQLLSDISYVRDNQEVLDRLKNIAELLKLFGYLMVIAVGISTLVIISHMIRSGIQHNQDQINTLRLLGAPEPFISFPFLLEGVLLTLGGGILAIILWTSSITQLYQRLTGPLPFIPLPPKNLLISAIGIQIGALSGLLGLAGSLFGLHSSKKLEH